MAAGLQEPPEINAETNVVPLIKGILADGQALLESQLELLGAELRSDWERTKRAACVLLAGVALFFSAKRKR